MIKNTKEDKQRCDSVKSTWDIRECFKQLRFDKNHHLGLGDIRLTIAQQEEICDLVERFYHLEELYKEIKHNIQELKKFLKCDE